MGCINRVFIFLTLLCIASSPLIGTPLKEGCSKKNFKRINPVNIWSQGNKHFTTTFYPYAKESAHNFVYSPISLQLCMGMAAELAKGETKTEILNIMALPQTDSIRRCGAEKIFSQLNTGLAIEGEPVHLALANGAWVSSESPFPPHFETLLKQSYDAAFHSADFQLSSEPVRLEINKWVADNTFQQINELLPTGSINSETKLVLVNTLYLRAPWASPFDSQLSFEAPFYGLEKSLRPISYMRQTAMFGFLEGSDYTVVELPFQQSLSTNDALSLFIIYPKENSFVDDLEMRFSTRRLDHWISSTEPQLLDLTVPKFKVSSSINAKQVMKSMGMVLPFSAEAEFDLVDQYGKLAITDILHQATFEIDETGGVGSAATGMIMGLTSYREPKQIIINHPFLFVVADKTTGIILFSGRVMQP